MSKKSLLALFIALALFSVALQVPTASARGWCDQDSGDCPNVGASFTGSATAAPANPTTLGVVTTTTPIFVADPLWQYGIAGTVD